MFRQCFPPSRDVWYAVFCQENKPAVGVTRLDQLKLKSTSAGGRGKGRGKGRGRGRGKAQAEADEEEEPEDPEDPENAEDPTKEAEIENKKTTKPKTQKKEAPSNDKADKSKSSKRKPAATQPMPKKKPGKNNDETWEESWEAVQSEWDQHWVEEWGDEWDDTWDTTPKQWDHYAWASGKSDLHALTSDKPKKNENKAGNDKTDSNDKRTKKASSQESLPSDTAKAKRKKADNEQTEAVAPCTKSRKTNQEHKPSPMDPQAMHADILEFASAFLGMHETHEAKALKKMMRDGIDKTEECTYNVYWTRCAVGVRSRSAGRDFAYFCFGTAHLDWVLRTATAWKSAEIFVTRLKSLNKTEEYQILWKTWKTVVNTSYHGDLSGLTFWEWTRWFWNHQALFAESVQQKKGKKEGFDVTLDKDVLALRDALHQAGRCVMAELSGSS